MSTNPPTDQDQLIQDRVDAAKNLTQSDDEVVQIAWIADGIDLWHRSGGKHGHSPDTARHYIISSVTRLIESEASRRVDAAYMDAWRDGAMAALNDLNRDLFFSTTQPDGHFIKKLITTKIDAFAEARYRDKGSN